MSKEALAKLVTEMDALNMHTMVNLSGGNGNDLKNGVANLKVIILNALWYLPTLISAT